MKKLHMLLAALLVLATLFSLAACGKNDIPYATDAQGNSLAVDTYDAIGGLILAGQDTITIYYSKNAKVTGIADADGKAIYPKFTGKSCLDILTKLLKESDPPIYDRFLLIRQTFDAKLPSNSFLEEVVAAAKAEIGERVVLCTTADLNENGYFTPEIAKAVLTSYLDDPAGAVYSPAVSFDDGYYEMSVTIDDQTNTYSIGAYYGRIQVTTFYEEPTIEEEYNDYFVDDGSDMYYDDTPIETE